jgi:hypothetical protein
MDAVTELLRDLEPAELAPLLAHLRAILAARDRADAADLIGWHSFSSLELAGIAAIFELRQAGRAGQAPRAEAPPPCYNARRDRACPALPDRRRRKGTT